MDQNNRLESIWVMGSLWGSSRDVAWCLISARKRFDPESTWIQEVNQTRCAFWVADDNLLQMWAQVIWTDEEKETSRTRWRCDVSAHNKSNEYPYKTIEERLFQIFDIDVTLTMWRSVPKIVSVGFCGLQSKFQSFNHSFLRYSANENLGRTHTRTDNLKPQCMCTPPSGRGK